MHYYLCTISFLEPNHCCHLLDFHEDSSLVTSIRDLHWTVLHCGVATASCLQNKPQTSAETRLHIVRIITLISKQDFCSHLGLGWDRQKMHVHGSGRLHPVMPNTTCLGVHRPSKTKKLP
jgi:hypothetical protein